jgi:hypothetical protein
MVSLGAIKKIYLKKYMCLSDRFDDMWKEQAVEKEVIDTKINSLNSLMNDTLRRLEADKPRETPTDD